MKTLETFYSSVFPIKVVLLLFFVTVNLGCSKDDEPVVIATPKEETKLSDKKEITSFVFLLTNNPIEINVVATIDEENKTITATTPPDTDLSGLLPEVKISALATIDRDTAQDFTDPLAYTVTAEDGSIAVYTVTITALLTQRQILQAILDANPGNRLDWDLNATANLGDLDDVTLNTEDEIIELNIGSGAISTLPPEIGQLSKLEILYLNNNLLTILPPEIGQLSNLTFLNLVFCDLSTLPHEIGQLSNLTTLNLALNQLYSLPPEIEQLSKLEILYLNDNQLTILPPEIVLLTELTELSLSSNLLTELPAELGKLTNLTKLHAGQNQLTELPAEIGQLILLKHLYLSNNELSSLPPEIGHLTNLETLLIWNNQFSSLPPEIGFLRNLERIDLQMNSISALPACISFLSEFNNLNVLKDDGIPYKNTSQKDALISIYSANRFNTLGWGVDNYPEVVFYENGDPKVITMNNENLTRLPNNIDGLSRLEVLNINSNHLISLPSTLGNIDPLVVLTADGNQLSTVPSELGNLNNFGLLSITNNPITSIPQAVCDQQISNGGILTILTDNGEGCN